MRIEITLREDRATAKGPFPLTFVRALASLSGRKVWHGSRAVDFNASLDNVRRLKETDHSIEWIDETGLMARSAALENLPTQISIMPTVRSTYKPKKKLYKHQEKALALSWDRESYALLLEMGLGKTAIMLANAGILHLKSGLRGVLIVAPKGVHTQWIEEQIPTHMSSQIKLTTQIWNGRALDDRIIDQRKMNVFAINVDAIRTPKGRSACEEFIAALDGAVMMIVDESHDIKGWTSLRTKAAITLGKMCRWRRISTGTLIGKNILDAFPQFYFLDPVILGHNYLSSFRNRYCITTMIQNRLVVVGQKRTEEFHALVAPHSFRLTKEEALDLPPKVPVTRTYEMGDVTRRHYTSMKKLFLTELKDGTILTASHAAVALMRLQQIVCGYLPHDDAVEVISNERIEVMQDIIDQRTGPVVIWARFREDIRRIAAHLEKTEGRGSTVTYYGVTKAAEREEAKRRFMSGKARFFISNAESGGSGLNLQGLCRTVIYYSNSFNALKRWQSEDRTHRMGTKASVTYFDIVAAGSVDKLILANLKGKKSLSDLTLDQIRRAVVAG